MTPFQNQHGFPSQSFDQALNRPPLARQGILFLVAISAFAAPGAGVGALARSLPMDGIVRMEDGQPVVAGTIIIREVRFQSSASGMPSMRPISVEVTDREGKFHADLSNISGSLDVRLVQDHCDWTGAVVEIGSEDIKNSDHISVKLEARRELCKARDR